MELTKNAQNAIEAINLYHLENAEYAPTIRHNHREVGKALYILKAEYPATKDFSQALETYCPTLPVRNVSSLIKFAGYGDPEKGYNFDATVIETWLVENAPATTSAVTGWAKFWEAHKPVADEPTESEEAEADANRTNSVCKRLEMLYEEIEADWDKIDPNIISRIVYITGQKSMDYHEKAGFGTLEVVNA